MAPVRLDHVYLSVLDMDRAVAFYEELLGCKAVHREGNTWADFDVGRGVYLGLIDPKIISNRRVVGNNSVIVLYCEDVDATFRLVDKWRCKIIFEPMDLEFTEYPYRCFQFKDTEGNLIEVAKY